jgi:hypothetical protein
VALPFDPADFTWKSASAVVLICLFLPLPAPADRDGACVDAHELSGSTAAGLETF